MKKYKVRKDLSTIVFGIKFYRIQSLKSFANVNKGDVTEWAQDGAVQRVSTIGMDITHSNTKGGSHGKRMS